MTTTAHGETPRVHRRALLRVLGGAFALPAIAETVTIIYANESWYRERPEREQEWTGILRKTKPVEGPDSRSALRYTFRTGSQSLPVYAPNGTEKLDRLSGVRVTARGKLVDMRSDGFGLELWIAAIRNG